MTLSAEDRTTVEAFLQYVEDASAGDDRYGMAARFERSDGSEFSTRFEVEPRCWLEAAVEPFVPRIRVGFVTDDPAIGEALLQAIKDSNEPVSKVLEGALAEAGVDWPDPPVEQVIEDEQHIYFVTPLKMESLDDLDLDFLKMRDKTLRLLEAYLIAFGSAIPPEDDE